jgi:hypothetical protein
MSGLGAVGLRPSTDLPGVESVLIPAPRRSRVGVRVLATILLPPDRWSLDPLAFFSFFLLLRFFLDSLACTSTMTGSYNAQSKSVSDEARLLQGGRGEWRLPERRWPFAQRAAR